jgi:antitoxin ParD1/3/4
LTIDRTDLLLDLIRDAGGPKADLFVATPPSEVYHILVFKRLEMGRSTSFSLGDHFDDFIDRQIASGRYGSASDVVRAGLRLLERDDAHLEALRAALVEGEQSGPAEPFDFDRFLAAKRIQRKSP